MEKDDEEAHYCYHAGGRGGPPPATNYYDRTFYSHRYYDQPVAYYTNGTAQYDQFLGSNPGPSPTANIMPTYGETAYNGSETVYGIPFQPYYGQNAIGTLQRVPRYTEPHKVITTIVKYDGIKSDSASTCVLNGVDGASNKLDPALNDVDGRTLVMRTKEDGSFNLDSCCKGGSSKAKIEVTARSDVSAVLVPQKEKVRRESVEMLRNVDYVKSLWIHCRLPLLILLFSMLFLFAVLSGALVYLKYYPHDSAFDNNDFSDVLCESVTCTFGASCHVEDGQAICRCPDSCLSDHDPVCGSDDLTYTNECFLRMFACQNQKFVRIRHGGQCGMDPCASRTCRRNESCVINRFGTAECTCAIECEPVVQPVCGSDGVTYDNYCKLTLAACRGAKVISVTYRGTCDASRACAQHSCPPEATCVLKEGQVACECPMCSSNFEPVCGSDGVSYQNECRLRMEACLTNMKIRKIHDGLCGYAMPSSESSGTEGSVLQRTGGLERDDVMSQIKYPPHELLGEDLRQNGRPAFALPPDLKFTRGLPQQLTTKQQTLSSVPSGVPTAATLHSIAEICSISLCPPPSSCFDYRNGSHSCVCPLGTSEPTQNCEPTDEVVPFFTGQSTIYLNAVTAHHKLSLELEFTPWQHNQHGILIFFSQHANGSGDFLSLALIDGYVEFRYDLGDGPAILRSLSPLSAGAIHHIVAKRYNRDGLLRVDGELEVRGTSPGTMKSLNLDNGGYLGYVPLNSTRTRELVGTSEGFIGCMHKLQIGRRPVKFESTDPLIRSMNKVFQCPSMDLTKRESTTTPGTFLELAEEEETAEGEANSRISNQISSIFVTQDSSKVHYARQRNFHDPEAQSSSISSSQPKVNSGFKTNPCQNDGLCWADQSSNLGYKCVCHPQFTGEHCETRKSKLPEPAATLNFKGSSYLELAGIANAGRKVSIEIWLLTRAKNGIILYNGQEMGKGDFITLLLSNGHVQFLFDLGSGVANITWKEPLSLNKWHWILATRDGKEGTLQVDGGRPAGGKSPPTLSELNLELPLYIGGVRDLDMIHRELGILEPFNGVLQYISLNNEAYHGEIASAIQKNLVERYEGPPCGSNVSPCLNGGTCFPRLDSFHCLCSLHFTGSTCDKRKDAQRPVHFDGETFIKVPVRVLSHELSSEEGEKHYGETAEAEHQEFSDVDDDDGSLRSTAQRKNRIEIVFRTLNDSTGLLLWTGENAEGRSKRSEYVRKGYLGVFLVHGHVELRVDLSGGKNGMAAVIRSKAKVDDGRWHQLIVVRQSRLIVLQVDGTIPQRAAASGDGNILVSDGHYWIGGVSPSVLPSEIPAELHRGFIGCVDLIRIENQRLPLSRMGHSIGLGYCEDDDR